MPTDLGPEVRAHVAWLRLALGRWLVADEPAPAPPPARRPRAGGPGAGAAAGGGDPGAGAALAELGARVAGCTRCGLAATRCRPVFGEGPVRPRLVVVGEAPGAEEDASGRPFVGAAGRLLTRMLAAIGLAREDVYICNLLKCRPPGNRNPRPDEVAACKPFLAEQLRLLAPELILALGSPATRELLATERGITSLRGRLARAPDGWWVLPTYHPAYLLRRPEAKREAWEDLQKVAARLGLALPGSPPAAGA